MEREDRASFRRASHILATVTVHSTVSCVTLIAVATCDPRVTFRDKRFVTVTWVTLSATSVSLASQFDQTALL